MPTYDYFCEHCGHEFEAFHPMTADPVRICPKCSHMSVKRKVSGGTGLIFKGSGFYITDYANKKNKNTNSTKKPKSTAKDSKPVTTKEKSSATNTNKT